MAAISLGLAVCRSVLGWPWLVASGSATRGMDVCSLALTILDWDNAFAGAILNSLILAVLWLGPPLPVGSLRSIACRGRWRKPP